MVAIYRSAPGFAITTDLAAMNARRSTQQINRRFAVFRAECFAQDGGPNSPLKK